MSDILEFFASKCGFPVPVGCQDGDVYYYGGPNAVGVILDSRLKKWRKYGTVEKVKAEIKKKGEHDAITKHIAEKLNLARGYIAISAGIVSYWCWELKNWQRIDTVDNILRRIK